MKRFNEYHGLYAGNHADVLKHLTVMIALEYLQKKEKGLLAVDTHAGAGLYALKEKGQWSESAQTGIARLAGNESVSPIIKRYLDLLERFNTERGEFSVYPGSPLLIWELLRDQDEAVVFEKYPEQFELLEEHLQQTKERKKIRTYCDDGLFSLKALLPPESRRGFVLIDPSYKNIAEYQQVYEAVADGLLRFPTGVYLIWYPVVPLPVAQQLPERLRRLAEDGGQAWLNATLRVSKGQTGLGIQASGVFVINPPFGLRQDLKGVLKQLVPLLGQNKGAEFTWAMRDGR